MSSILHNPKYRRDIDGLRALAVLAVILYHYFPKYVTGGFIGVDIFFVISGYLISTIIFDNLESNSFSFIQFYSRRVARIFPALIVVLAFCFAYGWFTLLVDEYRQLGKHILASGGFVQNLVLWSESGYFDNTADTKPLLHIWSLGIEEQFYLCWPLLAWLCWKRRINLLAATVVLAVASFVVNVVEVGHDPVATFFAPYTRFWELLAGGLLAWIELKHARIHPLTWLQARLGADAAGRPHRLVRGAADVLSVLGLLLLGLGGYGIDRGDAFPGVWALIPVAGALLILTAGAGAVINRTLLSNRAVVWIGLISYPLYLWHWPVLALHRITAGQDLPTDQKIRLLVLSLLLAALTYYVVERPIRFKWRSRWRVPALLAAMVGVASLGTWAVLDDGLPFRPLAAEVKALTDYNYFAGKIDPVTNNPGINEFYFFPKYGNSCYGGAHPKFFQDRHCGDIADPSAAKRAVLIGDSHAAYLGVALGPFLKNKGYSFNQFEVPTNNCYSLFLNENRPGHEDCVNIESYIREQVRQIHPDVLVFYAFYAFSPTTAEEYRDKIRSYLDLGVKRIVVVGPMPSRANFTALPKIMARDYLLQHKPIPERSDLLLDQKQIKMDQDMKALDFGPDVTYVSMHDFLCQGDQCLIRVGDKIPDDILTWDYGHLTIAAATYVVDHLLAPHF